MKRSRTTLALGIAVTIAALGAPAAWGATRYAEPGGDGPAASCPQTDPCDIQIAVEDASVQAGDNVVLLPGTYSLGSDTLLLNKPISVGGRRKGPRPTITGTANLVVQGAGPETHLHDVRVEGGVFGTVALIQLAERIEAIGASIACSSLALVRDSVCVGDGSFSAAVGLAVGCFDPLTPLPTDRMRNVTAFATGTSSAAVLLDVDNCDASMEGRNVIAIGEGFDVQVRANGVPGTRAVLELSRSAFNDVESNASGSAIVDAPTPGEDGNIAAEPRLADPAAGIYDQLPGSPTIDAGRADELLGNFDFGGERRVVGKRVDIGGDEFGFACKGRSATRVATGGGTTRGTNRADVIVGTAGRDAIVGRGGKDLICAGRGRDKLKGGGGKDRLFGEAGRDRLSGQGGSGDLCDGGPGADRAHRSCERARSASR